MTEFSFGFNKGSFLLLNSQKSVRSVAANLISNKQKGTEPIYQKRQRHGQYKALKPIFLNRSWLYLISTWFVKINVTWWIRHPYCCLALVKQQCEHKWKRELNWGSFATWRQLLAFSTLTSLWSVDMEKNVYNINIHSWANLPIKR